MRHSLAVLLRQPFASLESAAVSVVASTTPDNYDDIIVDGDDADVLLEEGAEPYLAVEETVDERTQAREELNDVVATLEGYCVTIESLLASGNCTAGTATLIEQGVQNQLGRLGLSLRRPSLESCDNDVVAYHQVTLEGVMDVIHRLTQSFIMGYNHHFDFFLELVRNNRKSLKVAKERLEDATENLDDKGLQSSKLVTGNLVELWYHFANDKGQTKDVLGAIRDDLDLSKAALVDYPKALLDQAKKIEAILRSAKLTNEASVQDLIRKVEALQHPADLFPQRLIGGQPFLSVTGVEIQEGTKVRPVSFGGKELTKLAALATHRVVVETSSFRHKALKVGQYLARRTQGPLGTVAGIASVAAPKTVELSIGQLRQAIELGHQYIRNVESSTANIEQWSQVTSGLMNAVKALDDSAATAPDGTNLVLRQVVAYCQNITDAYVKIVSQEQQRSFKGAKYVGYLCKRMSKYA